MNKFQKKAADKTEQCLRRAAAAKVRWWQATDPGTQVLMLTPDMAKELLQSSVNNRPPNPSVVAAMAEDIKNGTFTIGPGIELDASGNLQDGWTRLHAIAGSEKDVLTVVTCDNSGIPQKKKKARQYRSIDEDWMT